jgi:hypothetical protein
MKTLETTGSLDEKSLFSPSHRQLDLGIQPPGWQLLT